VPKILLIKNGKYEKIFLTALSKKTIAAQAADVCKTLENNFFFRKTYACQKQTMLNTTDMVTSVTRDEESAMYIKLIIIAQI
jgi:hypothetical protein